MSRYLRGRGHRARLGLILLIYLVLATTYSVVVPIGRGADEWAHYWYAQFIGQRGRLPASPEEREAAGYKSDWPPLYHLFAAGLTAWIETEGPPTFKYRSDQIRRQLVPSQGPEAILHTGDERFPWQQEILIWHVGRLLSIAFSTGVLIVTYLIGLELFQSRPLARSADKISLPAPYTLPDLSPQKIAIIAAAFLAFNPRFLFTGMLFNYDSLTLLLASLFLWLAIRVAKGYYPRWGFWSLGALAGLALITKYLAAPLFLIIFVVAWHTAAGSGTDRRQGTREQAYGSFGLRLFRPLISRTLWVHLGQAALAFLLVTGWWFAYLVITFNEIDRYGPVLGTVAPLLRGDGSDRTAEEIFALLSGGQAPAPTFIEKQGYTTWQIITELPTTFWGNPVARPYPLDWFVLVMSLFTIAAAGGLALFWWSARGNRFWLNLLLLLCVLALPFMAIRLFGARDAFEAVQGRHILFLAAPAIVILLVLGWWSVSRIVANILRVFPYVLHAAPYVGRVMFIALLGLLLTGALAQLIFMAAAYPPLLPVKTTPYSPTQASRTSLTLPGGASLLDYRIDELDESLQVTLFWQGGADFAPADYQIELALVDAQAHIESDWRAYQTQAHYPTRTWEAGDVIRDVGWLPVPNLKPGQYELKLRVIRAAETVADWQTLTPITLDQTSAQNQASGDWILWRNGEIAARSPTLRERETAQFTIANNQGPASELRIIGPDGTPRLPANSGSGWANFIIGPDWPAGDYYLPEVNNGPPVLRVGQNERTFQVPQISQPLEANFGGQVKLLGFHLPSRRVEAGDGLPLTLYWQGLNWMGEEFVIFTRVLDNHQASWGGYDRLAQENYSTLLWAPGEIVSDGFAVPVAPAAPDGVYTLSLGWYRQVEGQAESLPLMDPETGQPTETTSITIGPIKVGGPPAGITEKQVEPQTELNIVLDGKIMLLGFDTANPETAGLEADGVVAEPQPLEIILYWQALEHVETDYTVFAHLRNERGEIVAQADSPPAQGVYPTSLWDVGEIISDKRSIPSEHLSSGRYDLVVGLYDPSTGTRLPVDGDTSGAVTLRPFELGK